MTEVTSEKRPCTELPSTIACAWIIVDEIVDVPTSLEPTCEFCQSVIAGAPKTEDMDSEAGGGVNPSDGAHTSTASVTL